MSAEESREYVRPIDRIYRVATDRDTLDWKSFLHQLIEQEGLDPWDVDVVVLTKTYLNALKEAKEVDFAISGKLLTIAVFLLKTKAEVLVERDLRGIDDKIQEVEQQSEEDYTDSYEDLEALEAYDEAIEEEVPEKKKKDYKLKVRNPLARKRKVTIFDLIKTLEKTFEQSNNRQKNYFNRNTKVSYTGPRFERKKKDLKQVIEELYETIRKEFENKSGKVGFKAHIVPEANNKVDVLEKFIPLLHLHNSGRVEVQQNEHFGEIHIFEVNK